MDIHRELSVEGTKPRRHWQTLFRQMALTSEQTPSIPHDSLRPDGVTITVLCEIDCNRVMYFRHVIVTVSCHTDV